MKKLVSLLVVAMLSVFCANSEAAQWTKTTPQPQDQESGTTIYAYEDSDHASCRVIISDGKLAVSATDSNWYGKIATQYAEIGSGGQLLNNYVRAISHSRDRTIHDTKASGYWVFSAKCAQAAADLPLEVRQKFKKAFGVE